MIKEIWIDGVNTGFTVTDDGKVFNSRGNIRGGVSPHGYMLVSIRVNGKDKRLYVHRLVAKYFVPNDDPKNKVEVHHKDGNKLNNRASNLEWISKYDHAMRTYYENGTGSGVSYSEETIKNIIACIVKGKLSPKEIAKKFNVDIRLVHDIKNGISFTYLTKDLDFTNYNEQYQYKKRAAEKAFVFKLLKAGFPPNVIVRQIMDQFAYNEEESRYVYNYVLKDKENIMPYIKTKFSADARYKYQDYMKDIETMLLDGNMSRKEIVNWVMKNVGIETHQADDLIRQRIRALVKGNSMISTEGRRADVERLERESSKRSNRREELGKLNTKIDEMLINGDDPEAIVQMVRDSGIITGKTGRADNCRMQVTKRKFYLKNHGLLKE